MTNAAESAESRVWMMPHSEPTWGRRLSRIGWLLLGYTILVLLWGALVRVTGSGAGCGQHWPTCQGEILHLPRRLETVLEFGHRITSGLVLVFGLVFALLLRRLPRGHRSRKAVWLGLAFTLVDALIGAVLVLGRLVGENTSLLRALVMPAHLVSTCGLSAGFALAAFWARESAAPAAQPSVPRWVRPALQAFLGGFVVVAAMGAVTALGDTLYPVSVTSLSARVDEGLSGTAHFLERLRVVHPLLAVAFGISVIFALPRVARHGGGLSERFALAAIGVVTVELALGLLNVLLSAPGWMQIVHLAAAIGLWVVLVLTAAETLAPRAVVGG